MSSISNLGGRESLEIAVKALFRGILNALEYCRLVFSLVVENNDIIGAPNKILPQALQALSAALVITLGLHSVYCL